MSAGYMRRCARKKRFEEKSEAISAMVALKSSKSVRKPGEINVYRCDQCLGWHVGNGKAVFVTRSRNGKRPNKKMRGRM